MYASRPTNTTPSRQQRDGTTLCLKTRVAEPYTLYTVHLRTHLSEALLLGVHTNTRPFAWRQTVVFDYDEARRYVHRPNNKFSKSPTTMPICIFRLHNQVSDNNIAYVAEPTHENTGALKVWCSLSSSQNTAGLLLRKKKKGISGKKKPSTIPLWSDDTAVCDCELLLPPSSESIHCSSSTRACSSSIGMIQS